MGKVKTWGLEERCEASSWRGKGEAPGQNRCVKLSTMPHEVHRDECGNNFNDDRCVVTIGKTYNRT